MKSHWSNVAAWLKRCQRRHPTATGLAAGLVVTVGVWLLNEFGGDRPSPERVGPLATSGIQPRKEPPANPEEIMRDEIAGVLGFTGQLPPTARIRELMGMKDQLTPDELRELMGGLLAVPDGSEPVAARATWFHEIANLLQRQPVNLREFSEVLATVARDDKRDLASRDYALQHLRRTWDKATRDERLRRSIETTLDEMASARTPLQPSVLLSLHLLDPEGTAGMNPSVLVSEANGILKDDHLVGDEGVRCRMVACRIAGERRIDEAREPLLKLAASESSHALERMAAIAALGRFGNRSDLDALAALKPQDSRIVGAIRHALGGSVH